MHYLFNIYIFNGSLENILLYTHCPVDKKISLLISLLLFTEWNVYIYTQLIRTPRYVQSKALISKGASIFVSLSDQSSWFEHRFWREDVTGVRHRFGRLYNHTRLSWRNPSWLGKVRHSKGSLHPSSRSPWVRWWWRRGAWISSIAWIPGRGGMDY